MSFGFSVGDVIAVGKLIADIVSSLKDVGGSRADFLDLIRELECLQKALTHLDHLQQTGDNSQVDSIKFAALSCKRPLEEFLQKIRKYELSLGTRAVKSHWR